jgi:hypothetical protein
MMRYNEMHGKQPLIKPEPEITVDAGDIMERRTDSTSGASEEKDKNATVVAQREIEKTVFIGI